LASFEPFLKARWIALSAALAVFALFLFAPAVLNDGDTYLHIAAGRWMIENKAVLRIDFFSYTFAGQPWITHEWLAEIVMACAFVTEGWNTTVLLFAAAAALGVWFLANYLGRHLCGLALLTTLVLAISAMAGSFLCRPHILALPLMVVWIAELIRAADAGRRPPYWLLAVLVLWANLHASFIFGVVLILPFALESVLADGFGPALRRWGPFALAALLATLITPHGLEGVLFPLNLMSKPQLYAVGEWSALDLHRFQPAVLGIGVVLFLLISRGVRMAPVRLALLLLITYMALVHARHMTLLAVAGPLLLSAPMASLFPPSPVPARTSRRALAAFGLAFLGLTAVRLLLPLERADGLSTPSTALAHVPAAVLRSPVLNDYQFGGYLIFRDVHPFIDSRVEIYSGRFFDRYVDIANGNPRVIADTLQRYHIRWTILSASNPASAVMDTMPGWKRLYADPYAVVHIKNEAS
jgi:hypothetical protein